MSDLQLNPDELYKVRGETLIEYRELKRRVANPDYEAAALLYLDDDMHGDLALILTVTTRMVDAALGITEDTDGTRT